MYKKVQLKTAQLIEQGRQVLGYTVSVEPVGFLGAGGAGARPRRQQDTELSNLPAVLEEAAWRSSITHQRHIGQEEGQDRSLRNMCWGCTQKSSQ